MIKYDVGGSMLLSRNTLLIVDLKQLITMLVPHSDHKSRAFQ